MLNRTNEKGNIAVVGILVGIIAVVGLITLFSAMRSVDTGKVGVVTSYGRVTGRELSEGFAWVSPWYRGNSL